MSDSDYNDIIDLLDYDYSCYLNEATISDDVANTERDPNQDDLLVIDDIKVSRVQFNTKCFELFYNDGTSEYISYLMIINQKKYTPEELFYIACRNAVHIDIHAIKQRYFDDNSIKGMVKCQETGILSKWQELVVDHRQPNTFSMIVERFKEVNQFDIGAIKYTLNEQNHMVFEDKQLEYSFKTYHKEKAKLRVVRKECNSSRTGMARVKESSKDLKIK